MYYFHRNMVVSMHTHILVSDIPCSICNIPFHKFTSDGCNPWFQLPWQFPKIVNLAAHIGDTNMHIELNKLKFDDQWESKPRMSFFHKQNYHINCQINMNYMIQSTSRLWRKYCIKYRRHSLSSKPWKPFFHNIKSHIICQTNMNCMIQ
jgi:hypothetical protein